MWKSFTVTRTTVLFDDVEWDEQAENAKGAIAQASRHGLIRAARRSSGVRSRTSAFFGGENALADPRKGDPRRAR
jgi:hypothetical protein